MMLRRKYPMHLLLLFLWWDRSTAQESSISRSEFPSISPSSSSALGSTFNTKLKTNFGSSESHQKEFTATEPFNGEVRKNFRDTLAILDAIRNPPTNTSQPPSDNTKDYSDTIVSQPSPDTPSPKPSINILPNNIPSSAPLVDSIRVPNVTTSEFKDVSDLSLTTNPATANTNSTIQPTDSLTASPSIWPSPLPSDGPSLTPSIETTNFPSSRPTSAEPSNQPSTQVPTSSPSPEPTRLPTPRPTRRPTPSPTPRRTRRPTPGPTAGPTTGPTAGPTAGPTSGPTRRPTRSPTRRPTPGPTRRPTSAPTLLPSDVPPSLAPTSAPTTNPSGPPSLAPMSPPTPTPNAPPSLRPTSAPTSNPSAPPSLRPTSAPTVLPSDAPIPSMEPTHFPSLKRPTSHPSIESTLDPTFGPTVLQSSSTVVADPLSSPTSSNTSREPPNEQPTSTSVESLRRPRQPMRRPSDQPSQASSTSSSLLPRDSSSNRTIGTPSMTPTLLPSAIPTTGPTPSPSDSPKELPSPGPSVYPVSSPTSSPSLNPSPKPSKRPTAIPTESPSASTSDDSPSKSPHTRPSSASPIESLSAYPSTIHSASPTAMPGDGQMPRDGQSIPNTFPSLQQNSIDSFMPSDASSFIPSNMPSKMPFDAPSSSLSRTENPTTQTFHVAVDRVELYTTEADVMNAGNISIFEYVCQTEFLPLYFPLVYNVSAAQFLCIVQGQSIEEVQPSRELQEEQQASAPIETSTIAILLQVMGKVDLPSDVEFEEIVSMTFSTYADAFQEQLSTATQYFPSTEELDVINPSPIESEIDLTQTKSNGIPIVIIVSAAVGGAVFAVGLALIAVRSRAGRKQQTGLSENNVSDISVVVFSEEDGIRNWRNRPNSCKSKKSDSSIGPYLPPTPLGMDNVPEEISPRSWGEPEDELSATSTSLEAKRTIEEDIAYVGDDDDPLGLNQSASVVYRRVTSRQEREKEGYNKQVAAAAAAAAAHSTMGGVQMSVSGDDDDVSQDGAGTDDDADDAPTQSSLDTRPASRTSRNSRNSRATHTTDESSMLHGLAFVGTETTGTSAGGASVGQSNSLDKSSDVESLRQRRKLFWGLKGGGGGGGKKVSSPRRDPRVPGQYGDNTEATEVHAAQFTLQDGDRRSHAAAASGNNLYNRSPSPFVGSGMGNISRFDSTESDSQYEYETTPRGGRSPYSTHDDYESRLSSTAETPRQTNNSQRYRAVRYNNSRG